MEKKQREKKVREEKEQKKKQDNRPHKQVWANGAGEELEDTEKHPHMLSDRQACRKHRRAHACAQSVLQQANVRPSPVGRTCQAI